MLLYSISFQAEPVRSMINYDGSCSSITSEEPKVQLALLSMYMVQTLAYQVKEEILCQKAEENPCLLLKKAAANQKRQCGTKLWEYIVKCRDRNNLIHTMYTWQMKTEKKISTLWSSRFPFVCPFPPSLPFKNASRLLNSQYASKEPKFVLIHS